MLITAEDYPYEFDNVISSCNSFLNTYGDFYALVLMLLTKYSILQHEISAIKVP